MDALILCPSLFCFQELVLHVTFTGCIDKVQRVFASCQLIVIGCLPWPQWGRKKVTRIFETHCARRQSETENIELMHTTNGFNQVARDSVSRLAFYACVCLRGFPALLLLPLCLTTTSPQNKFREAEQGKWLQRDVIVRQYVRVRPWVLGQVIEPRIGTQE